MDFSSLKDQVSNLTLYDLKAGVRKVQNAVMNYTEMEAKVREATNNEPWGASSTLMQEIANATFSYQSLNEVMPMIYKRFTEKSAEEWRQIYKALQLLEFLIKNGSERVIDDARSHLSLLKMLRQFHYIDQNGKDQGINVRNRSKELAELLSDVERIRSERKKSRTTRNKYGGTEGGMGLGSGGGGSSSRYGGFGSETGGYGGAQGDYGGYSGGVYGDGGGFGGNESGYNDTQARRDRFEEYDEYDEGAVAAPGGRQSDVRRTTTASKRETKKVEKAEPPKPKAPEVDLFSFDDPVPAPVATSNGKAPVTSASNDFGSLQASGAGEDDDFDDFQSATPSTQTAPPGAFAIAPPAAVSTTTSATQFAAPQPQGGMQSNNIKNLFVSVSANPQTATIATPGMGTPSSVLAAPLMTPAVVPTPITAANPAVTRLAGTPMTAAHPAVSRLAGTPLTASHPPGSGGYSPMGPNYYQSVQTGSAPGTPGNVLSPAGSVSSQKPKVSGGDAFASLLGPSKRSTPKPGSGTSMAAMAKQQTSASLWGAPATPNTGTAPGTPAKPAGGTGSAAMDDLLG